jgi:glycerol-3-phosphate dehydrogenase (NAD(P)+)
MIGVIGAGSWGTAMAVHLARNGERVRLWARSAEVVEGIRAHRRNPWYLADVELPEGIDATADAGMALAGVDLVVIAVPSEFLAATLGRFAAVSVPAISATKGFEPVHHRRMSEVVAERWPAAPVAVLSGPTFAREVARAQPTAAVVAARDEALADELQRRLGSREFRLYTNRDVIGVEVGGAVKNVLAVGAGLSDGLGFGANTRIALITRGLAEMTRLGVQLGAQRETFMGLAGFGDLVLTCTDDQSRNRRFGLLLAEGFAPDAALARIGQVVEGYSAARAVRLVSQREQVEMPICDGIFRVLYEGVPADSVVRDLMRRPIRAEFG